MYAIIITGIVVFLGAITFFTPGQQTNKMLAFPALKQADTMNASAESSLTTDTPATSQPANFVPSLSPLPSLSPIPQPNGQSINDASSQIIALQQQVASQMETCISDNVQMNNQIISLQNQQQQLQNQINALVSQIQSIDATTPSGSAQQQALDQQRQQVQNQSNALGTAINAAQDAKNTRNNQCEATVSSLEQQRDSLEGNLDSIFNDAMNL